MTKRKGDVTARQIEELLPRGNALPLGLDLFGIIVKALPHEISRVRTLEFLTKHTYSLKSGGPAPPYIARLITELKLAGATTLRLPLCPQCQKPVPLPYAKSDTYLCRPCYSEQITDVCARCNRTKRVATRRDGVVLCGSCSHALNRDICSKCLTLAPVAGRESGLPICQLCLVRRKEPCSACGAIAAVHSRQNGHAICKRCYRVPPNGRGRLRHHAKRPARRRICSKRGASRLCIDFTTDRPLCTSCAGPVLHTCVACRRERQAHAIWAVGPICVTCYDGRPGQCDECDSELRVISIDSKTLCLRCAGSGAIQPCARCHRGARVYQNKTCISCMVDLHFEKIGIVEGTLLYPARQLLQLQAAPRRLLTWLRKSPGAQLLPQIASRNEIPTHRWLDQRDHHHTSYLRSILVRSGLLPARIESIDRFEVWLSRFIAAAPLEFKEVLTAFGRWHVLRRLRMMCERRGEMGATLAGARNRVRLGLHFLTWLKERSITLDQCRQADVDDWLATSSSAAYHVRPFLMWAARERLCRRLSVPQAVPVTQITPTPDKLRWKLVRRLLMDESMDDTGRIAGLLLLLYAQRISRIRNLTSKDFSDENGEYFARFARELVPLCPALAELVRSRLSANARSERCTRADGAVWGGLGFVDT